LRGALRSVIYDDLVIVIKRFVVRIKDSLITCSRFSVSAKCVHDGAGVLMERSIVNHECITGGITPLDYSRLSRCFVIDRVVIVQMVNHMFSIHDGIIISLIFSTVEMSTVILFVV